MIGRRSGVFGVLAGLGLAGLFVGVGAGTAGWAHLGDQVRADWWLLFPLLAGFAVQVALVVESRRRHRPAHAAAVSVGAGAGASALTVDGMAWRSPRWSGDQPGRHHRSGVLSFSAGGPAGGTVQLRLAGLPAPVTVSWTLPEG